LQQDRLFIWQLGPWHGQLLVQHTHVLQNLQIMSKPCKHRERHGSNALPFSFSDTKSDTHLPIDLFIKSWGRQSLSFKNKPLYLLLVSLRSPQLLKLQCNMYFLMLTLVCEYEPKWTSGTYDMHSGIYMHICTKYTAWSWISNKVMLFAHVYCILYSIPLQLAIKTY
jgi:hypothetical protein